MTNDTLFPVDGVIGQLGVTSVLVIEVMTTFCPAPVTITLKVATPDPSTVTLTGVCGTPVLL